MQDDEQPQAINISDIIQGESYSEILNNIYEISEGNKILEDLLLRFFFQNPSKEIHHKVNAAHNKITNVSKKKNYLCNHEECRENSIYSHELSERAILSHLVNEDNKAFILKRNLKENSFEFISKQEHIRNILSFPGYCKDHDQKIFHLLDQPNIEIDLEYINLQALKMQRYQIFDCEALLRLIKDIALESSQIISEHTGTAEEIKPIQEVLKSMQVKEQLIEERLDKTNTFYKKIWDGIQSKSYIIDYEEIPYSKLGWAFAGSGIENYTEDFFSFIFKIDINSTPLLIYAWDKNIFTQDEEKLSMSQDGIIYILLNNKDKLVFSRGFWEANEHKDLLLHDEEIYNYCSSFAHRILFQQMFFDKVTFS